MVHLYWGRFGCIRIDYDEIELSADICIDSIGLSLGCQLLWPGISIRWNFRGEHLDE